MTRPLPELEDRGDRGPGWPLLIACIGGGGVLGAWVVSLGKYLLDAVAHPGWVRDGQYGMVFMLTLPIGSCLGVVAACALMAARGLITERSGCQVIVIVLGTLLLAPFLALAAAAGLGWLGTLFAVRPR
jgi:hypothetical protein